MNTPTPLAGLIAFVVPATIVLAQAPFQNLDFELAQVATQAFPERVPFSSALPYWQGVTAGLPATEASYNGLLLDFPQIGLYDQENLGPRSLWDPIFGNYSASLMADVGSWASDKAELFQTGLIPAEARSIRFATTAEPLTQAIGLKPEDWSLSLLVNGMAVSYFPLETHTNYVLWGANISPQSGTVAEIRFSLHTTQPPLPAYDAGIALGLDGIEFSPLPVPAILKQPRLASGGSFQFLLFSQSGETYTVQFSTNLTNWMTLTNVSEGTNPVRIVDPGASNAPVRFYRTVSP